MDEILELINKPTWWFTTIFIGVAMSVLAGFIKDIVQERYSRFIKSWGERSKEKKADRDNRINRLSSSDHELYLAMLGLNQMKMEQIFEYVQAIAILLFAIAVKESFPSLYTIASIVAGLSMFLGLKSTFRHGDESLILLEAKFLAQERHNKKRQIDG